MALLNKSKRRSKNGNIVVTKVYSPRRHRQPRSSGCVAEGALVSTPHGCVPIESLQVGDLVLTSSGDTFDYQPILKKLEYPPARVLDIQLEGKARSLLVTPSHTLRVNGKWKRAVKVCEGDDLQTADQKLSGARVVGVTWAVQRQRVFNLVPATSHTFVVEGIVTHAFTHFRRLRTLAYSLFQPSRARLATPAASPGR